MLRFQEWWIERSRIDNMYALNTIILFRHIEFWRNMTIFMLFCNVSFAMKIGIAEIRTRFRHEIVKRLNAEI